MSATKRLRAAPTPADILRAEITELCAQIDRRNGTTPGAAERAVYFWHWPPDTPGVTTLTALYADAVTYLANLTTNPERNHHHV